MACEGCCLCEGGMTIVTNSEENKLTITYTGDTETVEMSIDPGGVNAEGFNSESGASVNDQGITLGAKYKFK